jgi:hypothetical protein
VPCIGIAPRGVICGRRKLDRCRGSTIRVTQSEPETGVQLNQNHTHYIIVDNQKEFPQVKRGAGGAGGEEVKGCPAPAHRPRPTVPSRVVALPSRRPAAHHHLTVAVVTTAPHRRPPHRRRH